MLLPKLDQRDMNDLLSLISSAQLTINGASALRVVQLQQKLAQPLEEFEHATVLEELKGEHELECNELRKALAEAESRADAANDALAKQITARQYEALER